jgi:RIO-like serine/threonine protein kinase
VVLKLTNIGEVALLRGQEMAEVVESLERTSWPEWLRRQCQVEVEAMEAGA